MNFWAFSADGDRGAFRMHRRHYSATNPKPKIRQFVGPGEKLVLTGFFCHALFAWRLSQFRRDSQVGVECTVFRNESHHRSSDMIREAVTFAWEKWPGQRLFTMVNPKKVRSRNPGYCFLMAGWRRCGLSQTGLVILELLPLAEAV